MAAEIIVSIAKSPSVGYPTIDAMFCATYAERLIAQQEWSRDVQIAIVSAAQHLAMRYTNNAGFVMRLVSYCYYYLVDVFI